MRRGLLREQDRLAVGRPGEWRGRWAGGLALGEAPRAAGQAPRRPPSGRHDPEVRRRGGRGHEKAVVPHVERVVVGRDLLLVLGGVRGVVREFVTVEPPGVTVTVLNHLDLLTLLASYHGERVYLWYHFLP